MFAVSASDDADRILGRIIDFLPLLVGAIVILILGYFVGKILENVVRKALTMLRFDTALQKSSVGGYLARMVASPAGFVGKLTYWLVILLFISFAVDILNITVLEDIVAGIFSYIPNIVAAVLIFLAAGAISAAAVSIVRASIGRTALGSLLTAVVPSITMGIAIFMILDQLKIAPSIVQITFSALMYSLGLGLALAFGLGGRDVAAQLLGQAYEAGKESTAEAKREASKQKARARRS